MPSSRHRPPPPRPERRVITQPLSPQELDELQALLDTVPAPLEALDVSMIDGYLCGVLLQPQAVPSFRWLAHITDVDGRPLPPRFESARIHALVKRRYTELNDAIVRRQWFDPWVFELENDSEDGDAHHGLGQVFDAHADDQAQAADHDDDSGYDDDDDDQDSAPASVEAVYPWVAGFATAVETFPGLMAMDARALNDPLALLYRHLDADDLEDAADLLAEIETMEPPNDLSEAVEELVRATLLLADISRPIAAPPRPNGPPPRRGPPRRPR